VQRAVRNSNRLLPVNPSADQGDYLRFARDSGEIRLLRVLAGYRHCFAHAKAIYRQLRIENADTFNFRIADQPGVIGGCLNRPLDFTLRNPFHTVCLIIRTSLPVSL
jgi:hypothetical protein